MAEKFQSTGKMFHWEPTEKIKKFKDYTKHHRVSNPNKKSTTAGGSPLVWSFNTEMQDPSTFAWGGDLQLGKFRARIPRSPEASVGRPKFYGLFFMVGASFETASNKT